VLETALCGAADAGEGLGEGVACLVGVGGERVRAAGVCPHVWTQDLRLVSVSPFSESLVKHGAKDERC
jgi:hypothetical protein